MIRISRDHFTCSLSRDDAPAARCAAGDTVVFETRDCYNNLITRQTPDAFEGAAFNNPATGPLFVEGAEPGDVLKIDILDIALDKTGVMRTAPGSGAFHDLIAERRSHFYDVANGRFVFNDKLTLETDPMIGVIGVAPAAESIPTTTPGTHGGNMDCRRIKKGATLYLPVNVPGALLSLGDLHALMGDGEVLICGLEIRGEVTLRVSVLKDCVLPTPFVVADGIAATVQSHQTLEGASLLAARSMHAYLRAAGMTEYEAGMLLSLVGNLIICQIVDPLLTVRMELSLDTLKKLGVTLP